METQQHRAVAEAYHRLLAGTPIRRRFVEDAPGRVHLLETGKGPALVLLHGTSTGAGMFAPLLTELDRVHAVAPDLPGIGLTEPVPPGQQDFRDRTVGWLDGLLDTLGLETTALLGHSGGGVRAAWYASAHPERVSRLILIGTPTLPDTRCPLPIRVMATPALGDVLRWLASPNRTSMLRLARALGEEQALTDRPELIDLLVAVARDPIAARAAMVEYRALVSPFALATRSGFRRSGRLSVEGLRSLRVPTLLVWGRHEPLGSVSVARSVAELLPHGECLVLPGGHAPWLGHPARMAADITAFVLATAESQPQPRP